MALGGVRPNSGRKKLSYKEKKFQVQLYLSGPVRDHLKKYGYKKLSAYLEKNYKRFV